MAELLFTLLEVNNPIRALEAMSHAIHSTHASCSITSGKLGMGLVHSVEARSTCIDLMEMRLVTVNTTY